MVGCGNNSVGVAMILTGAEMMGELGALGNGDPRPSGEGGGFF